MTAAIFANFREAPIGTGDVLFEGEAAENPVVEVGNIVYVPRGVVQVTVMGLVARPGTLEVRAQASASWECWRKREVCSPRRIRRALFYGGSARRARRSRR